jgi:hypothetical protein
MATRVRTSSWDGKDDKRKQNTSAFEQATFIPRELTPEEQAACKSWEFSEESVFDAIHKLVDARYKVTMRYDDFNECYGCWLLPDKTDVDNAGYILTGRGSSPYKAAKQALFKHYQLFEGVWPKDTDRRGGKEIDD